MKNNICLNLKDFVNYDYIIDYGYYTNNLLIKKNIELYQDYIFSSSYLFGIKTNKLIDDIIYKYIKDLSFQRFVEINLEKDDNNYFEDFVNVFINLHQLYNQNSSNIKTETRWL